MKDLEKASELARKYAEMIFTPQKYTIKDSLLEIAKWKEQQMIEKACYLYREELVQFNNLLSRLNSDYAGLVDVEKSYKDFKKAMEE